MKNRIIGKLVCFFMLVQLYIPCVSATAEPQKHILYTRVDLSNFVNSRAFADLGDSKPYFIRADDKYPLVGLETGNGSRDYMFGNYNNNQWYALNKADTYSQAELFTNECGESIYSLHDTSMITIRNNFSHWNAESLNQYGVQSVDVNFDEGNYSYAMILYTGWYSYGSMTVSAGKSESIIPLDIEKSSIGTVSMVGGDKWSKTFSAVNDKTVLKSKKILLDCTETVSSIQFKTTSEATAHILAVTLVSDEAENKIARLINEMPDATNICDALNISKAYDAESEISELLNKYPDFNMETNFSQERLKEKYSAVKMKLAGCTNGIPIDLSSNTNSKYFVSGGSPKVTYNQDFSLNIPDGVFLQDYMGHGYGKVGTLALCDESVQNIAGHDCSIYGADGIKYMFPNDNGIISNSAITVREISENVNNGTSMYTSANNALDYSTSTVGINNSGDKIYIVAFTPYSYAGKSELPITLKAIVNYSDGTNEENIVDITKIDGNTEAKNYICTYLGFSDVVNRANFPTQTNCTLNLYEYSVSTNPEKTIDSITFSSDDARKEFLILAVTLYQNKPIDLYIDSLGNDNNSGENPEASFKTVGAAINKAYEILEGLSGNLPPVNFHIKNGAYYVDSPIVIDGNAKADNAKWNFIGEDNAVFKGSHKISHTNIVKIPDEEFDIYKIMLADEGISAEDLCAIRDLDFFVNGKRQCISQWPDGKVNYALSSGYCSGDSSTYGSFFTDKEGGFKNEQPTDAYAGGFFTATYSYAVADIDKISNREKAVYFGSNANVKDNGTYKVNVQKPFYYKLYNLREEMNQPGEWCIDTENMVLYYNSPYALEDCEVELAYKAAPLFSLKNAPQNINFENLTFTQCCDYAIKDANKDSESKLCDSIRIADCKFDNSNSGVHFMLGSSYMFGENVQSGGKNIIVENNDFTFLKKSAVNIAYGQYSRLISNESKIKNNYIYRACEEYKSTPVVDLPYTIGTEVKNNLIHNIPATAISYAGNNMIIEYNEVGNTLRMCADNGCFYSGYSILRRNNEIAYNYLHDGNNLLDAYSSSNNAGIYLDDCLSGQNVHHNIIKNFGLGISFSGVDNTITNNTVLDSQYFSTVLRGNEITLYNDNYKKFINELFAKDDSSENKQAWLSQYPELIEEYEKLLNGTLTISGNVFSNNIIDYRPYIMEEFDIMSANTFENNGITAYRDTACFVDYEAQDNRFVKNPQLETEGGNCLNTDFDISLIGLTNQEQRFDTNIGFDLLYPKNGSTLSKDTVCFSWEEVKGADCYTFELYADDEMNTQLYKSDLTDNCFTMTLPKNYRSFFWRVRAKSNTRNTVCDCYNNDGLHSFTVSYVTVNFEDYYNCDISQHLNGYGMLKENTTVASYSNFSYCEPYIINQTFFEKHLEQDDYFISEGERFKFNLNGCMSINTYSPEKTDTEIDIPNVNCKKITFAAMFPNIIPSILNVAYSDGTEEELAFDIKPMLVTPATHTFTGGWSTSVCTINKCTVFPNSEKQAVKLIFKGTNLLAETKKPLDQMYVFAVNVHKSDSTVLNGLYSKRIFIDNYSKENAYIYISGKNKNNETVFKLENTNEENGELLINNEWQNVFFFAWNSEMKPFNKKIKINN